MSELDPLLERLADLVAERVAARLATPAPARDGAGPDRLLSAKQAAALLGVSERWLYRQAKTLPFARRVGGRMLRFSEHGLARWSARRGTA